MSHDASHSSGGHGAAATLPAPATVPELPAGQPLVDRGLVMAWFAASLFWTILAPVFGLLAAAKLDDPLLLEGIEWLQFGRLRISHVNGVIMGVFSNAVFGFMCYAVPKLTNRPLVGLRAAWWGFAIFNLAIAIGIPCLLTGTLQALEAGELPFGIDLMLCVAFVTMTAVVLQTIVKRRVDRLYVSLYYWMAALLWTVLNFLMGTFVLPNVPTGANSAAMHGFFLHNVVGLWITPAGLGIVYYVLPVATKARLYSHKLSLIGFWALAFFYPLNGLHHYLYSPIADWAQTIAIGASMMLILPVWAFSANVWGTMRGQWTQFTQDNFALKFLVLGAVWYLITCFQGPTQALRGMQALTHFGDYNVGHAHSAVFGAFAIWGMSGIYFGLSRLTGKALWSNRLGAWHYWLELLGFATMFGALTISGFAQGTELLTSQPSWISTVQNIKGYWLARTVGGTMMDLGLALFVFNVVMTLILGRQVTPPEYGPEPGRPDPAPAPAPATVGA
jgi:cytochrome c oxidase cbb3-type subunit 1